MANTSVIVIPEGKICDYVDGKFRNDTPEEYVRQTIEKRLVNEHKTIVPPTVFMRRCWMNRCRRVPKLCESSVPRK